MDDLSTWELIKQNKLEEALIKADEEYNLTGSTLKRVPGGSGTIYAE